MEKKGERREGREVCAKMERKGNLLSYQLYLNSGG
jgi:hypothetical protein